jgi:hypothetical protein
LIGLVITIQRQFNYLHLDGHYYTSTPNQAFKTIIVMKAYHIISNIIKYGTEDNNLLYAPCISQVRAMSLRLQDKHLDNNYHIQEVNHDINIGGEKRPTSEQESYTLGYNARFNIYCI